MLRWFPRLQVATACSSCSPPDLNFLDPYFIFMYVQYNHCLRATAHLQLNILLLLLLFNNSYRGQKGTAEPSEVQVQDTSHLAGSPGPDFIT